MTTRSRRLVAALAAVVTLGGLTACGAGPSNSATGPIEYWLWDSAQQPGYQKCADQFAAQNPGLSVHISQIGWTDYWSKLTSGMIADTAPDVFTDHLAKYAQYEDLKVLRPLDEMEATKDIQDGDFQPASPSSGRARTGTATACRRTGTPSRSSTTSTR